MGSLEDLNLVKSTTITTITISHVEDKMYPKYNALGAMNMDTLKE